MKVVFMGTPDFAAQSLKALIDSQCHILSVFTREDKPKNRGMKMSMPPVKELALEHGIPVVQLKTMKDAIAFDMLSQLGADIIVVAAYGAILPKNILALPKYGCINVHASILPKYRGASPINAAILHGEDSAGVTIMQMDVGLDTGDMLSKAQVDIEENETYGALRERLGDLGGKLLVEALADIENGEITPQKQDDSFATYAPLIKPSDAYVCFNDINSAVWQKIRAYDPAPGAFSMLGEEKIKLYGVELSNKSGAVGEILGYDKNGVIIACQEGAVVIKQVQGVGGKRMAADAFFRGHAKLLSEKFD